MPQRANPGALTKRRGISFLAAGCDERIESYLVGLSGGGSSFFDRSARKSHTRERATASHSPDIIAVPIRFVCGVLY